ncbi:MAG: DinB family protein [Phycisphaerales bacterium]
MNRQDQLAESLLSTKALLGRYIAGFTEVTHVRAVPGLPNHVAWSLGHLAITMYRAGAVMRAAAAPGSAINPAPFPAGTFVSGDGTRGSRDKGVFDTEAVSFGSTPEERHDRYPTLARCTEIFNTSCDDLAATIRALPESALDAPVRWGQAEMPLWALCARMVFHNGFHTGQVADTRRALGMKSVFS